MANEKGARPPRAISRQIHTVRGTAPLSSTTPILAGGTAWQAGASFTWIILDETCGQSKDLTASPLRGVVETFPIASGGRAPSHEYTCRTCCMVVRGVVPFENMIPFTRGELWISVAHGLIYCMRWQTEGGGWRVQGRLLEPLLLMQASGVLFKWLWAGLDSGRYMYM